jgi:hypothetical protein
MSWDLGPVSLCTNAVVVCGYGRAYRLWIFIYRIANASRILAYGKRLVISDFLGKVTMLLSAYVSNDVVCWH